MQIFEEKKVGRPQMYDPHFDRVQLRFSKAELAQIDTYRDKLSAATGKAVSRSAAIRALTLCALAQEESTIS